MSCWKPERAPMIEHDMPVVNVNDAVQRHFTVHVLVEGIWWSAVDKIMVTNASRETTEQKLKFRRQARTRLVARLDEAYGSGHWLPFKEKLSITARTQARYV